MKPFLVAIFLLSYVPVFSQGLYWSNPVAVAAGNVFDNDRPRITLVNGGNTALVTWGRSVGGKKAYVARYVGGGFGMPQFLNNGSNVNASSFESSEIAAQGDTVYAVYTTYPLSIIQVRLQSSFDGGITWNDPVWVDSLGSDFPTFANVAIGPDNNPVVSYIRQASNWADPRYVIRRSLDAGQTFEPEVSASGLAPGDEVCDCCASDLSFGSGKMVSIFRNNNSNLRDHWATVSTDNGATFSSAIDMDTLDWNVSICPTTGPSSYINGDSLYSVFFSEGNGPARVYFAMADLANGQLVWNREIDPSISSNGLQNRPMMTGHGDTLGVVWTNSEGGNMDVLMNYSFNGAADLWANAPINIVDSATGTQTDPDIAFANGKFHMVWTDNGSGNVMYRIGSTTPLVGVEEAAPHSLKLLIWPQPVREGLQLQVLGSHADQLEMEWYGLDGKVVRKGSLAPGLQTLTRGDLEDGIYFIRLYDPLSGESLVRRVNLIGG